MLVNRNKKVIRTNASIAQCRGAVAAKFEMKIVQIQDALRKSKKIIDVSEALERIAYFKQQAQWYREEEQRFMGNATRAVQTTVYNR